MSKRRSHALVFLFLFAALGGCGDESATPDNSGNNIAVNSAPTISGTPASNVSVGSEYSFAPITSDPDNDALVFSIENLPGWAAFDSATGRLSGVPRSGDERTYSNIVITVSDGSATASLPAFAIVVDSSTQANTAPTISGTPVTSVVAGASYLFIPTASDADNDALFFAIQNIPHWANLDIVTGTFSGVPQTGDEGAYTNIGIAVSDGQAIVTLPAFAITVVPLTQPNNPPTIAGTPATSVTAGSDYSFTPGASDPDDDPLSFSIQNIPPWASFDSATGRLSGNPQSSDEGTYTNIVIAVSDGQATAPLPAFAITVEPSQTNNPPTISGTPARSVAAGSDYSFTPGASDPDDDPLSFSIMNIPSWARFDSVSGTLSGNPQSSDEGTYTTIVIAVSDGQATASLPAFAITVEPSQTNNPPTISGTSATSVAAGSDYSFTPGASDPDDDPLSFSIQNIPSWASFDSVSGTLSGNPQSSDEGTYTNIVIAVSDGQATASLPAFAITVEPSQTNNPPTISGTPARSVAAGSVYSFTPGAFDPDDDPLSFSIQNIPPWASFDSATGRLSGNPQSSDEGTYTNIVIAVSDGQATASLPAFAITVEPSQTNNPPTISGTPATSVAPGSAYSFTPGAFDPDDDPLSFSIQNIPSWASFDSATGRLSGNPQSSDEGTYTNIVIAVSDSQATASLPAFVITVGPSTAPTRAFPGAEGFGAMSEGGRGGEVYTVTNLNNSGTGSLRWAIGQSGPRTVVFAVSGIIPLTDEVSIESPFITIAGQTSPAGVTVKGARFKVRTHDVIIRGLRVRPGDGAGMEASNRDGFSIGDQNSSVYNIIIDHSSFTWAVDENGSNWFPNERVTVQWSIFAEGLRNSIHPDGPHSMGYMIGPNSQQISIHHNIFADNEHRNPVIKDSQSVEVINNVGYNWRSEGVSVSSSGSSTLHAINNYYIHGPDSTVREAFYLRPSSEGQHQIYLSGNVDSLYRPSASTGDEWDVAHGWEPDMRANDYVFAVSGITTDDALTTFDRVLASAGPINPQRDPTDSRIITGIQTGFGVIIDSPSQVGGYHVADSVTPPVDTDGDGMPNAWEVGRGLNPENAADGIEDQDADGYTELEEYLNSFY